MGMLHVFLGVNGYVELIASIRIKIGATEAISEAGFEYAPRACACTHTIFFTVTCVTHNFWVKQLFRTRL